MPELPEVETTVNDLQPSVVSRRIEKVEVLAAGTIAEPSVEEFGRELTGRKIVRLTRRGKYLLFALDDARFLIVHLRMTGSLLVVPAEEKAAKFVRVVIYLDNGTALHFRDIRRFGRMWLVNDKDSVVGGLGPEPLEDEFSPAVLAQILKGRSTPVKGLLLDQTLIAGIGNMYADEALHCARLHPLRKGESLSRAEVQRLCQAIRKVLQQGIRHRGASTDTYIRPGGVKGEAHLQFQVAHRKGQKCPLCSCAIERIVVHQRGTFLCPHCQKLPRRASAD